MEVENCNSLIHLKSDNNLDRFDFKPFLLRLYNTDGFFFTLQLKDDCYQNNKKCSVTLQTIFLNALTIAFFRFLCFFGQLRMFLLTKRLKYLKNAYYPIIKFNASFNLNRYSVFIQSFLLSDIIKRHWFYNYKH